MAKVTVLGGCGAVGSVAVRTLVESNKVSEVVIADINAERAGKIAESVGEEKVKFIHTDVFNPEDIKKAIRGCDVVLNTTGPFYKFVKTILTAVIECRLNYVDVCDDVDVTCDILKMDNDAQKADITVLIGMGSSPGVTNLLAKFASDTLLDSTEAIDIYHAHGGEPFEGKGVIGHRFHCMSIDVPMFLDGKLTTVKFFEPDGIALREKVDFYRLGKNITVYPYPHPEQVTLPRFIKVNQVTNKGTVLPEEYYELTMNIHRLGMSDKEPLLVKGQTVVPYDFAIAYIIREREKILKRTNFGAQRGCLKIVVSGKKNGKKRKFIFSIASENQALGEGTGIPAAIAVLLMLDGKITKKGVLPPEGCINPLDFLNMVKSVIKPTADGKSFEGVLVESVDEDGNVTKLMI